MTKNNLVVWAGMLICLALFACGRKTLPVPPDAYVPPAVKQLSAAMSSGVITLQWIVPDGERQREMGLSRIEVFFADQSLCPDCPPVYEPVASISAWDLAADEQGNLVGRYQLSPEKDGLFLFYLITRSDAGMEGPRSDTVEAGSSPEAR